MGVHWLIDPSKRSGVFPGPQWFSLSEIHLSQVEKCMCRSSTRLRWMSQGQGGKTPSRKVHHISPQVGGWEDGFSSFGWWDMRCIFCWELVIPGDSINSRPFYPQVGGQLSNHWKGVTLNHRPKKVTSRIARYVLFKGVFHFTTCKKNMFFSARQVGFFIISGISRLCRSILRFRGLRNSWPLGSAKGCDRLGIPLGVPTSFVGSLRSLGCVTRKPDTKMEAHPMFGVKVYMVFNRHKKLCNRRL